MRFAACLALVLLLSIGTASAETQEHIGGWVLRCPRNAAGADSCVLRLAKRFLDKGGVTGDLEIEALGDSLVPVIAVRGVPSEMLLAAAMAGKAEASVRLGDGPREALGCAVSMAGYFCSPKDDAAAKLAAGLPAARSMTVRVAVLVDGLKPLPVQEKTLNLTGVREALLRFRAVGPSAVPGPLTGLSSQSPGALMGMADKALRAAGYANGTADLQALIAKYRSK